MTVLGLDACVGFINDRHIRLSLPTNSAYVVIQKVINFIINAVNFTRLTCTLHTTFIFVDDLHHIIKHLLKPFTDHTRINIGIGID